MTVSPVVLALDWSGYAVPANRRLRQGRGRWFRDSQYTAFLQDLSWSLRAAAGGRRYRAPSMRILVDAPRMDVDSLVKPILDALQAAALVENDRDVIAVTVERAQLRDTWPGAVRGPHCLRIEITEA